MTLDRRWLKVGSTYVNSDHVACVDVVPMRGSRPPSSIVTIHISVGTVLSGNVTDDELARWLDDGDGIGSVTGDPP